MGLWNFVGGNKIGPGHPRYERDIRKAKERAQLHYDVIAMGIMQDGVERVIAAKGEEDVIEILKYWPTCPKVKDANGRLSFGVKPHHVERWKEAQKWLRVKENPEEEISNEHIKNLERKISEEQVQIKALELEIQRMEKQLEKLELTFELDKKFEK